MGILRKLPGGLAAGTLGSGASELAAWASISPPGTAAASKPLVAARNSLRPIAEFLGRFFMPLLGKRSNGVSADVSAALYVSVMRKQEKKIVFLTDSIRLREARGNKRECELPRRAAARHVRKKRA